MIRSAETQDKANRTIQNHFSAKVEIRKSLGKDFNSVEGCLQILEKMIEQAEVTPENSPANLKFLTVDERYYTLLNRLGVVEQKQYKIKYQQLMDELGELKTTIVPTSKLHDQYSKRTDTNEDEYYFEKQADRRFKPILNHEGR